MATAAGLSGGSTLLGITDNQKRWLVFGIALSKVLVPGIRSFVEAEVQREYGNLQTSHSIHTQSTSGRLQRWPTFLKYENINGNDAYPKLPGRRYDYANFDCRVTSHVDFAKLYVENHMTKFNAFDEHCDASAVLALLGKVPVFSPALQAAAGDVRQARNVWAHCVFSDWDPVNYQQSFLEMETLVNALGLLPAIERNILGELKDWETKGTMLCMNASMDPDLLKLVQQHVNTLKTEVEQLTFDVQEDRERVSVALRDISTRLEELEASILSMQREQEVMKQHQSSLSCKMDTLQTDVESLKLLKSRQEDVEQRVAHVEKQLNSTCEIPLENREVYNRASSANDEAPQQCDSNLFVEIASFEADIAFFAKRHDSDTRQWFFDDFDKWFRDPGDSRAYVLLGDPGVGKSVMAGALAQRMRNSKHLGAAYFCRHNDGTRNDPRYLLGTVACQLCEINSQYNSIVGGEGRVRNMLSNSKLGVRELFTKLLQEPLGKCNPNQQRKLVIIDALDETQCESREDFLDLIMHRFPLLPKWLVFFITSRPEDSVQFRLKKYNPCVKICAGNDSDDHNFYQQHEQDIQTFLKKRIDCSRLSCTVEDIARKCHGLFLYAHYIVEELRLSVDSGKNINQLSDLFPGDIDDFFLQNLKRVYDQVGQDLFKKLFGCAVVAPSPLPVSIISYILTRENSNHDEQQVIDAVSQFVVLRTSDQTLTFLHSLIPAWLTDKKKARKLSIDKKIAGEYLRNIFDEILKSSVASEPQPTCPSAEDTLNNYVSRVAVRFLCQYSETGIPESVFSCLTSYHFIERRMLSGRIEIYHLLEDLKLVASKTPPEEVKKQEILHEIFNALESNVLVLLECPHLLRSCFRIASNTVQEAVLIPQVSDPWLEWNVYAFPDIKIADIHCLATSPDGRTVAGAKGRTILLFDASTAETVKGPFEVSNNVIVTIDQLEFSPDGKFLFFGRLDKWFSVEGGCVEDFPQFSGNSHIYQWGVLTRDRKSIVVKRKKKISILRSRRNCQDKYCLSNLLALWALKEIEQDGENELTVMFSPRKPCCVPGVQVGLLFKCLGIGTHLDQTGETLISYNPSCHYCCRLRELTESSKEPSLVTVRQLLINLYPKIFFYQVWDVDTGVLVLQQVFSQLAALDSFSYLCHLARAYSEFGAMMGCSGLERGMSVCNIAAVTAVYSALGGDLHCRFQLELLRESELLLKWKYMLITKENELKCDRLRDECLECDLDEESQPAFWKLKGELQEMRESGYWLQLKQQLEKEELLEERQLMRELGKTLKRCRRLIYMWGRPTLNKMRELTCKLLKFGTALAKFVEKLEMERLASAGLFKDLPPGEVFKFGFCIQIPEGFQDLGYYVYRKMCISVSPNTEWIIEAEAGDSLKLRFIQTGKLQHTINKFESFSFTNDDLYLVYSCAGSLYALSLQTGAVLTSVTGFKLYCFTREGQVGYLFRSDTEEKAIFLKNLFSPFKFLSAFVVKLTSVSLSAVGKSIAASFLSSDTVMSVGSDFSVSLWQTTSNKKGIAFISMSSLTVPDLQLLNVKNYLLSPDRKLIAIHRGAKVQLYSFEKTVATEKCPFNVFESKDDFTVVCFAFSVDSALLLFCIRDSRVYLHFYVWDIPKNGKSASFKLPGLVTVECCCLSSSKRELILCGEYQIEIWEYAKHPRLFARLAVERPCSSVKFSQCTVSLDNHLLVCCIANTVLVYSLHASDINSSKRVLRGHLGRIEFCRFLKVNRYLISYGVDGMVFLWDLSEWKAVGFARVTENQDRVVSMAVSPEEDRAVCFTSSGRICVIKLRNLGCALPLKPLTEQMKGEEEGGVPTRLPPEQITLAPQTPTSSGEDGMDEATSSSDSEEDFLDYYLEPDLLLEYD